MSVSKAEHDELCCVYAALLLHDEGSEITAEKLNKIIKASGNQVDSYYPEFFASYLKTANINDLISAKPAGGAPTEAPAKVEEKKDDKKDDKKKKKEEKKKVEEEEEEGGMFDMFG